MYYNALPCKIKKNQSTGWRQEDAVLESIRTGITQNKRGSPREEGAYYICQNKDMSLLVLQLHEETSQKHIIWAACASNYGSEHYCLRLNQKHCIEGNR